MPELIIKTSTNGSDPQWQDGDIIHAMNDLRIHNVHAQHICLSNNLDKDNRRWIDRNLAEMHLAEIYQYRTERISKTEARVTDQWTLESIIKSDVPNQYGHIMYVDEFFRRRMVGTPWLVFGSSGAEVWYHGKARYLATEDTHIWNQIEMMTAQRKVNYTSYPRGNEGRFQNLVITVDDFDEAERGELESSILDDNGNLLRMRKNKVDWKTLPGMTQNIIDDVDKPDVEVDIRADFLFTRSQIVEAKSVVAEL